MSDQTVLIPVDGRTARPPNRYALVWEVALPLVIYLLVGLAVALKQSERLNPDGVCYLRIAGYLAAGNWNDAISTYWSPLFPWSISPLLAMGINDLDAARLMQLVWGAILLIGAAWFLRSWTTISSAMRTVAMLLLVWPVIDFEIFVISPDVTLSALLLCYFAALGDSRWRGSMAGLVGIGLLGGLAYWAKAYALPFILIHLPVTLWLLRDQMAPRSRHWRNLGLTLAGFCVPVLVLVAVLSWKNGAPTIGSSGAINHAVVGPSDKIRYHPVVFGLPSPPHISVWETPEKLPYQFWSPWESKSYFKYQWHLAGENAGLMAKALTRLDEFWLCAATVILLLPLAWLSPPSSRSRRLFIWSAFTLVLYLSGYLFVAYEPRYANSLLLPLIMAAFFQAATGTFARFPRWLGGGLVAIFALSMALRWAPAMQRNLTVSAPAYMREIADSLREMNFRGPFASTSWYHGMALAYYTGQPTVGFPPDADPALVADKLRETGTDWIVIWDMPFFPPLPVQDLYPPTIPRANSIVDWPEWTMRKSSSVSFGDREAHIRVFQRTDPSKP